MTLSTREFHPPLDLPLACRTQGKQITGTNLRRQAVFALVLNTSTSTVQKRKTGEKPSGPSLKLLSLFQNKELQAAIQYPSFKEKNLKTMIP